VDDARDRENEVDVEVDDAAGDEEFDVNDSTHTTKVRMFGPGGRNQAYS
jgi:hypothetical protein